MKKAYCDCCKKEAKVKEKPMDYVFVIKGPNEVKMNISLQIESIWDILGIYKTIDLCQSCRYKTISIILKEEISPKI